MRTPVRQSCTIVAHMYVEGATLIILEKCSILLLKVNSVVNANERTRLMPTDTSLLYLKNG